MTPPENFSEHHLRLWRAHCVQQYWFYYSWYMDWCLNCPSEVYDACTENSVSTEKVDGTGELDDPSSADTSCCADGDGDSASETSSQAKESNGNEGAATSCNPLLEPGSSSVRDSQDNGDDPNKRENKATKRRGQHEMDVEEDPVANSGNRAGEDDQEISHCLDFDPSDFGVATTSNISTFRAVCSAMGYQTNYSKSEGIKHFSRVSKFQLNNNARTLPKIQQISQAICCLPSEKTRLIMVTEHKS